MQTRHLSPTGDDNANGETQATAWATCSKVNAYTLALTAGETARINVESGTYVGDGFICRNDAVTVCFVFERNVVIDTSQNVGRMTGISFESQGTFVFFLNAARFLGNSVESANGIGGSANDLCYVFGADKDGNKAEFSGFDDGYSVHTGSFGCWVSHVKFLNCVKSAVYHVGDGWAHAQYCDFYGAPSGASANILAGNTSSNRFASVFYKCRFLDPVDGPGSKIAHIPGLCIECEFGAPGEPVFIAPHHVQNYMLIGNYINFFSPVGPNNNGPGNAVVVGNYGRMRFNRIRGDDTTGAVFANNVFTGDSLFDPDYSGGSVTAGWLGGSVLILNNIFTEADSVVEFHHDDQENHMNANWIVEGSIAYNVTTPFESGLTIGSDTLTINPLLGSSDSVRQNDYAFAPGSPAEASGIGGLHIGLAIDSSKYLGLDAAGVRSAIGLASADLDTQLSSLVTIYPIQSTAVARVSGSTLQAFTGETVTFSVFPLDATGSSVDTTSMALEIKIEGRSEDDLETIADGSITKTSSQYSFTTSGANVANGTKRWSCRRTDTNEIIGRGDYIVIYAAD